MQSDEEEEIYSEPQSEYDELSSSDEEEPTDRSFGQQYEALLNAEVPSGKCPILCFSKIPARITKMRERENKKIREGRQLVQAKRTLLNATHKGIETFDEERENRLRKKATKGVIQLFNSDARAQNKPELHEPVKEEDVPKKKEEFLQLLLEAAGREE
ncbi:hypothetical protein GPJ56_008454 [Histomonas meleagridis]|uniref:uncharacterized protein n=1 Tax=Histomonas meleagridis TaxID=135588 RepID=UPI00355ACD12|nr:hypothetical protein GPJ56_008454 [Histomonas meleagridis]KAH0806510.1 hypothetical protein GO595_000672 [Histomonas meleagridis]